MLRGFILFGNGKALPNPCPHQALPRLQKPRDVREGGYEVIDFGSNSPARSLQTLVPPLSASRVESSRTASRRLKPNCHFFTANEKSVRDCLPVSSVV